MVAASAPAAASLPPPVVTDILRNHRDLLRVGCATLGGRRVSWITGAEVTDAEQFEDFLEAFIAGLRQEPEVRALSSAVLARVALWFCKAVSINYVLADVLRLLEETVGVCCSIETCEPGGRGPLVEYRADIEPGPQLRVSLVWDGRDNLVYRKAGSKRREVKGTVRHIETKFSVPPVPGASPDYSLNVSFTKAAHKSMPAGVRKHVASKQSSDSQRRLQLTASSPLEDADVRAEDEARTERERGQAAKAKLSRDNAAAKEAAKRKSEAQAKKKAEAERKKKVEAKLKAEAEKKALDEAKQKAEEEEAEVKRKEADDTRKRAEDEEAEAWRKQAQDALLAAAARMKAEQVAEANAAAYWRDLRLQRDVQKQASSYSQVARRRAYDEARARAVATQLAEDELRRSSIVGCCLPVTHRDEDSEDSMYYIF